MRRLAFAIPDIETVRKIVDELIEVDIDRDNIHVVAKYGVALEGLPNARRSNETSDYYHAVEKGLAFGGVTGMLAGLIAVAFPPAGFVIGGGAVLATTLAGAGLGAFLSGIVGSDMPDSYLKLYEDAINAGEILMMVDVGVDRIDEINELIKRRRPEAEVEGVEPLFQPL